MAATYRLPLLTWAMVPDSSGNVWLEPFPIAATNDVWGNLVARFKDTSTRIGLYSLANIPKNYNASGTTSVVWVWSSTATSGNVVWECDYRCVTGDDTASLDQSGTQGSITVTDAAPTAAWRRLVATQTVTASDLAADGTLELSLWRNGASGSDTMAADAFLFGAFLQYTD